MNKKVFYLAVALSCALLLMPAQMRAQAGLQTDADGSVTGTAGTEYLWVNAANFPDDSFRLYLQQMVASESASGRYVVPANITHLDVNASCCEYYLGQILSNSRLSTCHYSWEREGQTYTNSSYYNDEPVPSPYIEQINAFFQDPQNVEEVQNSLGDDYDYILYHIMKCRQIVISTIEVSDGVHRVLKKDIEFYRAEMCRAAADAYELYDSERVLYRDFIFSESETLHSEHNYYQPSGGDISDLTGIEHFANLRCLNCSGQNLRGELDLTALTKLDSLDCSNNQLTDLKVNLVAHPWWDSLPTWSASDLSYIGTNQAYKAHQRVYLNCSNNYLTHLNNVTVTPTAEGQLVNIEGSYDNNRILAFPQGKHPYYDLEQGIFAYGGRGDNGYWDYYLPYDSFVLTYMFYNKSKMNATQETMFEELGFNPDNLPFNRGLLFDNEHIALYLHPYDFDANGKWTEHLIDEDGNEFVFPTLIGLYSSKQNFGVNLSVIDKSRNRVGVAVPDNICDDESAFEDVVLLDNIYPEKIKQDAITYYAYNASGSATGDLDYCHTTAPVSYSLFNGYLTWTGFYVNEILGVKFANLYDDISDSSIEKYGDWFDPNINTYMDRLEYGVYNLHFGSANVQRCTSQMHRVTLNADHYVMYVNPISEDTEGLCNGTVVLDYDAIIPEGMEAFIVTSYTAGGESDRFKTGRLNLVKVGDGDCADGYKRVIPANNPVCLRTKQTVSEGQAADKMSTTGLYPFHRNNDRTLYPCPDPNDAQYEPLELIPSALFDGNKLRGVLDMAGQSYTAGDVLTLGRYKDNNEHKIGFWTYNGAKLNMHRVYVLKSELNIPSAAKGCTLDFGYDSTPTGIGSVGSESRVIDNGWYTLQGVRLSGKPAQSGIYIHNGKKVVVDSDNVTESGSSPTTQEEVYTDNF